MYLTYVLHAVEAYLAHLGETDQWTGIDSLYLNLAFGGPEDLVDSPDVLPRIAKELIQESVRRHADVAAAMARRLDRARVEMLWAQQAAWRTRSPEWWFGVPPEWAW